jgi:hypothetical protein
MVIRMDDGPQVAYYLGKNHEIAESISELPKDLAAMELGRLAARLDFERKKAAEKPVSKAPPPAPTIEGSGDPGLTVDPASPDSDKLSDAEWAKRRARQIEKRRNK